jgi:hypothetical protein
VRRFNIVRARYRDKVARSSGERGSPPAQAYLLVFHEVRSTPLVANCTAVAAQRRLKRRWPHASASAHTYRAESGPSTRLVLTSFGAPITLIGFEKQLKNDLSSAAQQAAEAVAGPFIGPALKRLVHSGLRPLRPRHV